MQLNSRCYIDVREWMKKYIFLLSFEIVNLLTLLFENVKYYYYCCGYFVIILLLFLKFGKSLKYSRFVARFLL